MPYVTAWLTATQPRTDTPNVIHLAEADGARGRVFPLIVASVMDHLVGDDVLSRLRYAKAAQAIRNRIPTGKRIRSGTLGEIIATDYVIETGPFVVPLKRLRYQDDREMAMRGDDIIGVDTGTVPPRVLKAEVKSRVTLSASVVTQMCEALDNNDGRPKPSSLAFTSMTLRREGKDALARVIEELQEHDVDASRMTHVAFTLSANDPTELLYTMAVEANAISDRRFIGAVVADHQAFIAAIFAACNA